MIAAPTAFQEIRETMKRSGVEEEESGCGLNFHVRALKGKTDIQEGGGGLKVRHSGSEVKKGRYTYIIGGDTGLGFLREGA